MAAIMVAIANETIDRTRPPEETHRMSPMPPKRPAGTESAYASPAPQQAARPGFGGSQVDFTDQASFAADVDDSPYATAKSAKRAAKALGKPYACAPKKAAQPSRAPSDARAPQQRAPQAPARVPIPGTVDMRTQMHVVVGGTHHAPAHKAASPQASHAPKPASAAKPEGAQQTGPQPNGAPVPGAAPAGTPASASAAAPEFPSEAQYVKAAKERPAASANIARPKPKPAPAQGDGRSSGEGAEVGSSKASAAGAAATPAPADQSRRARPAGFSMAGAATASPSGRPASAPSSQTPRPAHGSRIAAVGAAAGRLIPRDTETLVRRASIGLTCLACVVAACVTLYTPAQQLYSAMRENERLTDELAQNQARVDALKKSVSSLQTAEGVQDMAHKTWGLVMPDEVPVTVDNASYTPTDTPIPAEVKRGSGRNTSTWVTDVLDQVFGEAGATDATEKDESVATLSETGGETSDDTAESSAQTADSPSAQDGENNGE